VKKGITKQDAGKRAVDLNRLTADVRPGTMLAGRGLRRMPIDASHLVLGRSAVIRLSLWFGHEGRRFNPATPTST